VRPMAGPFILTWLPLRNVHTMPPTNAEIIPEMGGAPDATAMPRDIGNATKDTLMAAVKSSLKWTYKPLRPWYGSILYIFSKAVKYYNELRTYYNTNNCTIFKRILGIVIDVLKWVYER